MDQHQFDHLARQVAGSLNRRYLASLTGLGLVGLALLPAESDAKKKKKKKAELCLEGQTLSASKKKKRALLKRGATLGACPSPPASPAPPAPPAPPPGPPPPPRVCTDLQPTDDLQAAIDAAEPGGTIRLCAGSWSVTSNLLIAKDLTIIGAGREQTVLNGDRRTRMVSVGSASATVTIQDLTIMNGTPGISNGGTLTLRGVLMTRCNNGVGGAIFNAGTLTLAAGTLLTENGSFYGGAIESLDSTLILEAGSSVTRNMAEFDGGGIRSARGALILKAGSSVTGNTAKRGGGGIAASGTTTLEAGSTVTDNEAPIGGGMAATGTVTLQADNIVVNNRPDNCEPQIGACT